MKIDPFTVVSDNCYTLGWHGSVVVRTYINVLYSVRCLSKQLWKAGSIYWQIVLKFCPCERQCSFSLGNQTQLQIVFNLQTTTLFYSIFNQRRNCGDILSSKGVILENKTIHTPPPCLPFKNWGVVVFYRQLKQQHNISWMGWGWKTLFSPF